MYEIQLLRNAVQEQLKLIYILRNQVQEQLELINKNFDKITGHFLDFNNRIEPLEEQIKYLEERVVKLEEKLIMDNSIRSCWWRGENGKIYYCIHYHDSHCDLNKNSFTNRISALQRFVRNTIELNGYYPREEQYENAKEHIMEQYPCDNNITEEELKLKG